MNEFRWYAGLAAAVLNDLNDITGFGSIPIIGDILDVATATFLWPLLDDRERLLMLNEFLPYADYLPTYTAVLVWNWKEKQGYSKKRGMRKIKVG